MALEVGMKNSVTLTVTDEMCADHLDSQLPQLELPHVLSTPSMINLMELTCAEVMNKHADEGKCSVGMAVDIKHVAATPPGRQDRIWHAQKSLYQKIRQNLYADQL